MKIKVICLSCISGVLIAGGLAFQPAVTSTGFGIKPSATPKSRKTKTKPTTSAVQPTPPKRFKVELPEELEDAGGVRTRRNGNRENVGSSAGVVPQPTPGGSISPPRSNTPTQPANSNSSSGYIGGTEDGSSIRRRRGNSNRQVNTNRAGGTRVPANTNTATPTTTGGNRQSAIGYVPMADGASANSPRANTNTSTGAKSSAAPIRQKRRPKTKQ